MTDPNVIQVGGERYLLAEEGKGKYALPAALEDHLAAQLPTTDEALPGFIRTYSTTWYKEAELREGSPSCNMPGCPKPHVPRGKFCGYRHARA